jgi:hypothetical protein
MGVEERAEKSSAKAAGSHKIIHIDMDALYASVEQHDNPEPRLLGGTEGSQTLPWRGMDSNFQFRDVSLPPTAFSSGRGSNSRSETAPGLHAPRRRRKASSSPWRWSGRLVTI